MRLRLTSIVVEDQARALAFYTDVLGFEKRHDIPVDPGGARWITVVAPEGPDELELSLEPNGNPAAKAYQQALFAQGIPLTAFESTDLVGEVARLKARGVEFTLDPTPMGPVTVALFNDTVGNLIQLYQPET